MPADWREAVQSIHQAPGRGVIVVTGGGASAIARLLSVPGGSRTILEAVVPYSAAALAGWLGKRPESFCSEETALAMAAVAFQRAGVLAAAEPARDADANARLIGLACTAALVSDRPKKGEHRCHVAVQSEAETISATLVLDKGARDREAEEDLVSLLILRELARAAGAAFAVDLPLRPGETVVEARAAAGPLLRDLRTGRRAVVWSLPGGRLAAGTESEQTDTTFREPPAALLCGAFNPLHFGHRQLRDVAERILGAPVGYELSLRNVDKPPLDDLTLERRRAQFTDHPLALTAAPTFAEKAAALPGKTFVVGADTAERIIDARYYGGDAASLRSALSGLRARGCRFLVAGREREGRFQTLADLSVPAEFADLFAAIPADAFRADVSSTELRRAAGG